MSIKSRLKSLARRVKRSLHDSGKIAALSDLKSRRVRQSQQVSDKIAALSDLKSRAVPIASIIDVGVRQGTFELKRVFPELPHLLFEPVEEFAQAIGANYEKIDHTLVHAAVCAQEGGVTLETWSNAEGIDITHSQVVSDNADGSDRRTVPGVTLDGYLATHSWKLPYLLKLDVDGSEMQVLQGATETLSRTSVVIIEVTQATLTERVSFLEARGFAIFDLVSRSYYDGCFHQCDAILISRAALAQHFETLSRTRFNAEKFRQSRAPA